MTTPLLVSDHLDKTFDIHNGLIERLWRTPKQVRAVRDVSFAIHRGETLGVIGESGCGKSTLARVLLRLREPTGGRILFDGEDITATPQHLLAPYRKRMQIVFQDPYASLNPRKTIGEIVGLPLRIHERLGTADIRKRVLAMLDRVGLAQDFIDRYPHQFSGGQRQRVSIARALIVNPDLVICDEAVSALDASVQAQILLLLAELRASLGLTYLFISHNIAVVGYVSDRIAVMYLGEIVEMGPARALLAAPRHPYTQMLMRALPRIDRVLDAAPHRDKLAAAEPLSALGDIAGCPFRNRCPRAQDICAREAPVLRPTRDDRIVACHFADAAEPAATAQPPP